jgi:valyl-tRNA synthetase
LEDEREAWLKHNPQPWNDSQRREYYERFSAQVEDWLDAGSGSCLLRDPEVATIVGDALRHFDGQRYDLGAWVVMPNHVHALVTPRQGFALGDILHSWKSFTAHAINRKLGQTGAVWQHESYDHIVRDEAALAKIQEYVDLNPEKAGIEVTQASRLRAPEDRKRDARATIWCDVVPPADPENWEQDPDVLDTWFSSWLWPFATMGWPEKTETLAKFYPTTDLVTGPDIIFFWVARMIMAGFEYMGELPFRNVYFTGIIRDKQGRKMSKSLGNSPDPLDLIAKYGADALRFGVMRSAPLGSDILFDEKNVELGRNFCTKLWNAVRFRQMQGGASEGEIQPELLTSDDRWILARLDDAVREVTVALEEYRFSDATATLYRFFWNEFCDWYLEASKAVLFGSDQASKANCLAVIDFVLGHTIRLFHPFLPFITEELWHSLGFHEDMPAGQGGETIMTAPWPKAMDADERAYFGLDEAADKFAAAKYEVVNLGRGLRRDFNIASSKRVRFVLKPSSELTAHDTEVLRILLNAEPFEVSADFIPAKGTPVALTPLGELFLPLEGLIDVAAERERLAKELAKVEQELTKVRAKLADPNFAGKVPAKVLDEHRQREKDWADKHAQLMKMREALGGE